MWSDRRPARRILMQALIYGAPNLTTLQRELWKPGPMLPPHFAFDPERSNNDDGAWALTPKPILTTKTSATVGIGVLSDDSVPAARNGSVMAVQHSAKPG
jgi:hypothetical protein